MADHAPIKFVRTYRCPVCKFEMVVKYAFEPKPHGEDPRDLEMQCGAALSEGCPGIYEYEGTVPA